MPVGRLDFFFFIFFFHFWVGVVLQFFGNTVICLMCPINSFSEQRWRKESGRNLYLSSGATKNYLEKKKSGGGGGSPPDYIGKKVPVGRSTGNDLLFEGGLRAQWVHLVPRL